MDEKGIEFGECCKDNTDLAQVLLLWIAFYEVYK